MLDFEFVVRDGGHPEVVCLVAHELYSGQWLHIWKGGFGAPPFQINTETLFIGYAAAAEWSCFIALGWPMPLRCIDLYAEFIRINNGKFDGKLFPGLLSASSHFGINTMAADQKGAMRDLILTGGPWDKSEQHEILHYCAEDVRITGELFRAMQPYIQENNLMLGGALLRGRYTCAVARMEWNGVPIDTDTLQRLRDGWDIIKQELIAEIDKAYGVFDGTTFVAARFANWVRCEGIAWPRLPSSQLSLSDETFRQMAKKYAQVAPLRELRHALGKLRLTGFAVGNDGRNRTGLMPFGSKTGRNQPSSSKFIFGSSRWLRSLIKPEPGRAIAYVDWSSQEIAIAAALSGDEALWEAYISGDPYMAFARQAGLAPSGATKATHKHERQRAKAIVLGVGYGMGAESIALSSGLHIDEARELLLRHKMTYRRFWEWATANQDAGLLGGRLHTTFGWTWQAGAGTKPNARSLLNWPMQANGAEMMRLACCLLTEQGIMVCCPVHDALLVEGSIGGMDQVIAETRAVMEQASELVLGQGRIVRTDVELVVYPERFADEAAGDMWERVINLLDAHGC